MPHLNFTLIRAIAVCSLFFVLSANAQTYLVPETIERLKSPDPEVRILAAGQLSGYLKDERAIEPLISLLNDSNDKVREAAVESLGWFKDARAVPQIIGLLNDNDFQIRFKSVRALGMIGDAQAIDPLINMLETDNFSLKAEAAEALGKIHDARAVEPLIKLLNTDVGHTAEESLVELGPLAVEPLCDYLTLEYQPLRWYAAKVLTKVADERAIKPLISMLEVSVNALGMTAAETLAWRIGSPAIDELIIASNDKNPEARRNAVFALGNIKYKRVAAPIITALKDVNSEVRLQALKAISNLESDRISEFLVAALDDPALWVEASLRLGEKRIYARFLILLKS